MAIHAAPGGRIVLSGLLATQADAVADAYLARGLILDSRETLGEWAALVLRQP